jgi:hypothetical protein
MTDDFNDVWGSVIDDLDLDSLGEEGDVIDADRNAEDLEEMYERAAKAMDDDPLRAHIASLEGAIGEFEADRDMQRLASRATALFMLMIVDAAYKQSGIGALFLMLFAQVMQVAPGVVRFICVGCFYLGWIASKDGDWNERFPTPEYFNNDESEGDA